MKVQQRPGEKRAQLARGIEVKGRAGFESIGKMLAKRPTQPRSRIPDKYFLPLGEILTTQRKQAEEQKGGFNYTPAIPGGC